MSEGPDSAASLMRRPHPRRWLIVIGLGIVALLVVPVLVVLLLFEIRIDDDLVWWFFRGAQFGIIVAVIGAVVLLRRRDAAPLRQARTEYAAKHPGAVVEAVSFDPLWMPEDAARPRDPSARTYGLVAADPHGLTVIEEGTVILAAAWSELSSFGPGPGLTFTCAGHEWSISPLGRWRSPLQRIAVVRPRELRVVAGTGSG